MKHATRDAQIVTYQHVYAYVYSYNLAPGRMPILVILLGGTMTAWCAGAAAPAAVAPAALGMIVQGLELVLLDTV
jgi:hypothetical protein